ncbi:hypothetical protein ABTK64_19920, partial [Acinetobacter baumannii]
AAGEQRRGEHDHVPNEPVAGGRTAHQASMESVVHLRKRGVSSSCRAVATPSQGASMAWVRSSHAGLSVGAGKGMDAKGGELMCVDVF